MNKKLLIILVLLAVIALGTILIINPKAPTGYNVGTKIFPELPINQVDSFSLTSANGTVILRKHGGEWVVGSYYDYPASFDKIHPFLKSFYDMNVGQVIKVRPKSLGRLALINPKDQGKSKGKGTLIQLFDKKQSLLATCILGKDKMSKSDKSDPYRYVPQKEGQYLKLPQSDKVFLISQNIELNVPPQSWIERMLYNLDPESISDITVMSPANNAYTLKRGVDGFICDKVATNQSLNQTLVNDFVDTVANCYIDGIEDPAVFATNDLMDTSWALTANVNNGLTYTITVAPVKNYLQVGVTYNEPDIDTSITNQLVRNKIAEESYKFLDKARLLNESYSKWTYKIHPRFSSDCCKKLEALINIK